MLNWIAGYVDRWAGFVARETRDLVHWGLHALAGVVYTVFGHVGKAWGEVWRAIQWAHGEADLFNSWVVTHLRALVTIDIPRLAADALSYLQRALTFARQLYGLALAAVEAAVRRAEQLVTDAIAWVVRHVYDPLAALAAQLRTDLLKWGYYAYQLVTHPDQLAVILLDSLIKAAEAAFWRIAEPAGEFALRLIVANLARLLKLADAILAAVL